MVTKTKFKGALTKEIVERITLKDIIKERKANKKKIDEILRKHKMRMKKSKFIRDEFGDKELTIAERIKRLNKVKKKKKKKK